MKITLTQTDDDGHVLYHAEVDQLEEWVGMLMAFSSQIGFEIKSIDATVKTSGQNWHGVYGGQV